MERNAVKRRYYSWLKCAVQTLWNWK